MTTTGLAQRQTAAHDAIAARLEQLGASVTRRWVPHYDLDLQRFRPFHVVSTVNGAFVHYNFFCRPGAGGPALRIQIGFSCNVSFSEDARGLDFTAIAHALLAQATAKLAA